MIEAFYARNFKSLREITISNLNRINIIVGQSASGKSAILEAIRLSLSAIPSTAFNIAYSRGMQGFIGSVMNREQFDGVWTPLFSDFKTDDRIRLSALFTDARSISADFFFDPKRAVNVTSNPFPNLPGQSFVPFTVNTFVMERSNAQEVSSEAWASVSETGGLIFQGEDFTNNSELLPAVWQPNAVSLAERFSQLSVENEEFEIIEAVRMEFPEILGLSIQGAGQGMSVHAAMKGVKRKMPLGLVSSGINKFVALLIAVKTLRGGVLLVDEIENGIYWKLMPKLWAVLHLFACRYDVQLFVTTHSLECINAARPVIDQSSDDFTLMQVLRADGNTTVYATPGENLAAALETNIELRR